MAITDDFGAELVHLVTWRPFVSDDAYGNPSYGAPQTFPARVDFTRVNFVNARGQVAEARGEAYFAPLAVVPSGGMTASEIFARSEYMITTGAVSEFVQPVDVSVTDDDVGVPYCTRLIFG